MGPDVEGQGTHFSGRHRGLVAYGAAHQGGVECDCASCAGLESTRRGEGGRVGFDPRTPNTLDYSTMLGDILFNVFCTDLSTTMCRLWFYIRIGSEYTSKRSRIDLSVAQGNPGCASEQPLRMPFLLLLGMEDVHPSSSLGRPSHWPNESRWPTHVERMSRQIDITLILEYFSFPSCVLGFMVFLQSLLQNAHRQSLLHGYGNYSTRKYDSRRISHYVRRISSIHLDT